VVEGIVRVFRPLPRRPFPGIPDGHPAAGAIIMNRSANVLGLDNAATPLGLTAMKELQSLNREPDRATDEMILFMVMNASSGRAAAADLDLHLPRPARGRPSHRRVRAGS
jgi:spore maturation protein SpmA